MVDIEMRRKVRNLRNEVKSGAFMYFVAAVATVLNSIMIHFNIFGSTIMMPTGMCLIQCIDRNSIFQGVPTHFALWQQILFCALAAMLYLALGYYALKGRFGAHILGFILFVTDAFCFGLLLLTDYTFMLCEVLGGYLMVKGILSLQKLKKIERSLEENGEDPIPLDDNPDGTGKKSLFRQKKTDEAGDGKAKKRKKSLYSQEVSESVIVIDPAEAWPEPVKNRKKAKAERLARESAEAAAQEQEKGTEE